MKNKKTIFLVVGAGIAAVAIILAILLIVQASRVSLLSAREKESIVTDKKRETVVTDKDELYEIGANYIKEKFGDLNTRKESDDYQVFVDYHKFNITKDDDYYYAYMWVLSESYFVKNTSLYRGRSNSSLYKIVFKDDKVHSYEMPDDGKTYESTESYTMEKNYDFPQSLKEMCPNNRVYDNIMNSNVSLSTQRAIEEHYAYLGDLTIHSQVLSESNSKNDTVPYPNDKAHGGSGYVPR